MRDPIAIAITDAIGMHVYDERRSIGGGSIHAAFAYLTDRTPIFVKVCALARAPMLAAEAAGLRELAATQTVRVPKVLALGSLADQAFICLEWLDFAASNPSTQALLGEKLAALHAHTADIHGWDQDTFIGLTPQSNERHGDWIEFWREERLAPQLELAVSKGADARTIDKGRVLCESSKVFFTTHRPQASLLHGDLWGGNCGATRNGEPVIFDPAVYYGDRETDLAMTRLFGGFSAEFYAAYESAWPVDPGAASRATLYNLYHVLNHFNLFGGGYLAQARMMIDRLLADLGG